MPPPSTHATPSATRTSRARTSSTSRNSLPSPSVLPASPAAPNGDILVAGPLSIHGVTREVEFAVEGPTPPVKDPWGNTRVGVTASTKIDRREFGLTFNAALETGGVLVGEEVRITLELEFVQAA